VPERPHAIAPSAPGRYGAPGSGVVFAPAAIGAAWNIQGDATRGSFAGEAERICGVALPVEPNTIGRGAKAIALWLGPRSWLLLAGDASALGDPARAREALDAAAGALFDLSDARVAWRISGASAASVLAKACPLDFHPRAFAVGACAQSVFGHVNALYLRDADGFTLLVARSFARDVWHALCESAEEYGYEVQAQAPYR